MCDRSHTYTVEVIGQPARYVGDSDQEAVSSLLGIDIDASEEGYVVAEHFADDIGAGVRTAYCPAESGRLEGEAIRVRADFDAQAAQWAQESAARCMASAPF